MRWTHRRARGKLEAPWKGPFPVEKVLSETRCQVEGVVEHVYNLRRFVGAGEQRPSQEVPNL
jgi:hypothetical protein